MVNVEVRENAVFFSTTDGNEAPSVAMWVEESGTWEWADEKSPTPYTWAHAIYQQGQFTIAWNGPGWYGPQQVQGGEAWYYIIGKGAYKSEVDRLGRGLGTPHLFKDPMSWILLE